MARILQTVLGASKAGAHRAMGRTSSLYAMGFHGDTAARKALGGFMGRQALMGAGLGAGAGVGMNMAGNMANGDNPFRGTFGAALRGGAVGAAGGLGALALKRNHAGFRSFAGPGGAMGKAFGANPAMGQMSMGLNNRWTAGARRGYGGARGHYHTARNWMGL